jgi:hypothetical protein
VRAARREASQRSRSCRRRRRLVVVVAGSAVRGVAVAVLAVAEQRLAGDVRGLREGGGLLQLQQVQRRRVGKRCLANPTPAHPWRI